MPRLRAASPRIEEELEKIRDEAKTRPPMRRQLAAIRYYLQGVIQSTSTSWYSETNRGVTNYVRLLQRVEAWRSRSVWGCPVSLRSSKQLQRPNAFTPHFDGLGVKLQQCKG